MNYTFEDPPADRAAAYTELIDILVQHPGRWIRPEPEEITGKKLADKRRIVLHAAKRRSVEVETAIRNGALYVRSVGDVIITKAESPLEDDGRETGAQAASESAQADPASNASEPPITERASASKPDWERQAMLPAEDAWPQSLQEPLTISDRDRWLDAGRPIDWPEIPDNAKRLARVWHKKFPGRI